MGRVKIKSPHQDQDSQFALLRILSEHHVFTTRLATTRDGFWVVTSEDSEVDTICNPPCHDSHTAHRFTPVLPPEIRAKRTVLLFRVNNFIKAHTPDKIKEEVQLQNDFAANMVDQVF